MPTKKAKDSEVHAYQYIREQLKFLSWDIRNPERIESGQVWTQNECLSNLEIKSCLCLDRPENIVKVSEDVLWIIEAKRSHSQLSQAIEEAKGYANKFRGSNRYSVRFITGVAGNEIDSFLVRTYFFDGAQFVPVKLNDVNVSGFLRQSELLAILDRGNPDVAEIEVDERLFLSRAEAINEILHLGAVNPHQRAGVMAALLLSMLGDTPPNVNDRDPATLVGDINNRVKNILRGQGKDEFFEHIRIDLPSAKDNHVKLRQALVDTIQELNNLNIRSAMNSGADWLGAFYEVFLKYARWAQDLGIVLTPRHITRWVADIMDIGVKDIVLDPTCGTGGFLVAGFDYVKNHSTPEQLERFKKNAVFGIEQDAAIAALAVVNMIFRGDGRNNIQEGNCFSTHLTSQIINDIQTAKYSSEKPTKTAITKVMMNPPFALKRSNEKEFVFIEHALAQMEHGGILFSILPYSAMVKQGVYRDWRRDLLLPNHTLLSVITFPIDIFYPVGVTTVGIFIRKGIPHPLGQKVLWVRALSDGLLKRKGKRLPNDKAENTLEETRNLIKSFLHNPLQTIPNVEQFYSTTPIDFEDKQLELVPEVYLDQAEPRLKSTRTQLAERIRYSLAYLIKINCVNLGFEGTSNLLVEKLTPKKWKKFKVDEVFNLCRGHFHSIADLDPGLHITISRNSDDNGFVGMYEIPDGASQFPSGTITISTVTGDAFVQPVPFIATDNVVMCTPKPAFNKFRPSSLMFAAQMLSDTKWRYSYGRQCYKTKYTNTPIYLPVTDSGALDYEFMELMVESQPYWSNVESAFNANS